MRGRDNPESIGRTVVVIDDERPIADAISRFLAACGWDVVVCSDAQRGLDAVVRDPPFVLLTDMAMPGLDGVTLVRRMRAALGERAPRVMFISANEPTAQELELVDTYRRKPFRVSELERTLRTWAEEEDRAQVTASGTRQKRPSAVDLHRATRDKKLGS